MENLVLIDSNVFIDFIRAKTDPILEITRKVDITNVLSCGVVKAEVMRGIQSMKFRERLERFFSITQMIGTPASLWDEVWQMAWQLDRKGKTRPLQDIVIACCAMRAGAAVMTSDKHFGHIPGLRVMKP